MDYNYPYQYHQGIEKLVQAIASKANTTDLNFVRVIVMFYLGIITSTMRTQLLLAGDRPVPLNVYATALAPSGAGKGVVTSSMEKVLKLFVNKFYNNWEALKEKHIASIATVRASTNQNDYQTEYDKYAKEMNELGTPLLWFSEGTSPAFKQMRSALSRVNYGSSNCIVDEVFSVDMGADMLQDLVVSYDVGQLKQKLIKHGKDSPRVLDSPNAAVPSQLLMFGTGALLQDPTIYNNFTSGLRSGLARRCIFSFADVNYRASTSAKERYQILTNTNNSNITSQFNSHIDNMSNDKWLNYNLTMTQETHIFLLNYQIQCEERANLIDDVILKTEMEHRYMKVAKLAGICAVWDNSTTVNILHLQNSIKLVEDSGIRLAELLKTEPLHVKLANYLVKNSEVTMSQVVTDLPWFGSKTKQVKAELIQLATEYGHTHNMIISSSTRRGIDYLSGKSMPVNKLDSIILSKSDHQAYNYINGTVHWENLHLVVSPQGTHWVTHHVKDGHRDESNVQQGFNLIVIDVDNKEGSPNNVPIEMAMTLLSGYKMFVYETKSSTPEFNRYRIVFPLSHTLYLDEDTFSEFMKNIYTWLPIPCDEVTAQRSRKWLGNDSNYFYKEGSLLPALDFIPETERNLKKFKEINALSNFSNIDRWFIQEANDPSKGRNNALLKYGLMILDYCKDYDKTIAEVLRLNKEIKIPLAESEIMSTIAVTLMNKQ